MLISKNHIKIHYPKLFLFLKKINQGRIFIQNKIDTFLVRQRNKKLKKISDQVYNKISNQVLRGPFKGLKLTDSSYWHPAKIIGAYEEELYETIQQLQNKKYQTIINIGCGDGYFAAGFAKLFPKSRVEAYDINHNVLLKAEQLAKLNNLHNISFNTECTHDHFKSNDRNINLIFCDIEGCELGLLNPQHCPDLLLSDLIVETHDCIQPGVRKLLIERFKETHKIITIQSMPRRSKDYPELKIFNKKDREFALNEFRHGLGTWLWMKRIN